MYVVINSCNKSSRDKNRTIERDRISKNQKLIDEYVDAVGYIPSFNSEESNTHWIYQSSEILLNVAVPIPIDNIEVARQYLWDMGLATKLNIKGRGIEIGALQDGTKVFCSKYYDESRNNELIGD
jgi:hypothetical protein